MMLELLLIFHGDPGKDFGGPLHVGLACFLMLSKAGVGPLAFFDGFFVFLRACVNGAMSFPNVDGFFAAATHELINPFAFAWRGAAFIFST